MGSCRQTLNVRDDFRVSSQMLSQALDVDLRLGMIERFPTVLHARASLIFDLNTDTFQKTLIQCLCQLQESIRTIELSLSDHPGYLDGTVGFRVGVGDQDGFDILDKRVEDRVLRRITAHGVFQTLDLSLDLHYKVKGSGRHRVQGDHYLTRMFFQTGRVELLIHHLKGLKRVQPDDLVHMLVFLMNRELSKKAYQELEIETLEAG